MKLSTLSSFPGILLWIYGLVGLILIASSLIGRRRIPPKGTTLADLQTEAKYWDLPEVALADFSYALRRFTSSLFVGFGFGSLLFTLAFALLLMSPIWSSVCAFSIGTTLNTIWLFICIIAAGGSGLYAFHRLQRETRTGRVTGPRRTLSDYRSPLFFLVPVAWLVLSCTLVVAFHPLYLPANNCAILHFPPVPWQWWIAYAELELAAVALFTMELLLSRIASTTSPLVPSNLPDPNALDDMFRSKIINMAQYLVLAQIFQFSTSLPAIISDRYSFIPIIFTLLIFFVNLKALRSSRGLGGKLTGWFWQTKRTT